jgi:hypothetical protein
MHGAGGGMQDFDGGDMADIWVGMGWAMMHAVAMWKLV